MSGFIPEQFTTQNKNPKDTEILTMKDHKADQTTSWSIFLHFYTVFLQELSATIVWEKGEKTMRFESTWRTLPEQYTLMLDAVCIDSSDEQDDEQEGLGVEKDATK